MAIDVHIKGVVKSSLIDYPGKVSCVVFLDKCNFRCKFCHNPELVFDEYSKELPDITVDEFMDFLTKKKKWLDGVVMLGGEPTLHPGLLEFMKLIKENGFSVKLDTNGSSPELLRNAIEQGVVDYIAMDIKNSKEKYDEITNSRVNIANIEKSIRLIMDAGAKGLIDYDFRTTALPRFHTKEDFEKISGWLSGAKKYVLQQFKTEQSLVDDKLKQDQPFLLGELEGFKKILEKNIKCVEIRE